MSVRLAGWRWALPPLGILLLAGQAHATVTNSTRSITFDPAVNTTTFSIPYSFYDRDWLLVTLITEATSAEQTLVRNVNYRVQLPSSTQAGAVIMISPASVGAGYKLRIERIVPVTQLTPFIQQGDFSAYSHEVAFDKLTMIAQQIIAQAGTDATTAVAAHEGEADPHPQYVLRAGRSGGETIIGGLGTGEDLVLESNALGDGLVQLGTSLYVNQANGRVGVGTSSPSVDFHISGDALIDTGGLRLSVGAGALTFSGSASSITMDDNDASALDMGATGALDMLRFDTTNAAEALRLGAGVNLFISATGFLNTPYVNGGAGSGDNLQLNSTQHATKGLILFGSSSAFDDVNERLGIGTTSPTYAIEAVGYIEATTGFITGAGTLSCADNGVGTAAACTATNAEVLGLIEITCNDANGCDLTLDETSAIKGTQLLLINVGTNTVNLVDSAGVQETAAPALGQWDVVPVAYGTGRWFQTAPVSNN